MNKTAIKNYAIWARVQLIEAAKQRAYEYEITEKGENKTNLDTVSGRLLTADEKKQRQQLIEQIRCKGYAQVMEEAAYTWFNRFIALRFMEVNGFLPSKVRIFTDENGVFKPEILKEAMTVEIDGLVRGKVLDLLDKQNNEGLYKYLLITQCNALNDGLPYMFERIANWTELLFPANLLRADSVIGRMVADIPEEDWQDAVQIIGWLYQYYNSELKDETFALLKRNVKISKERIPAATQLFTPDWIVRYMVENSLGRLWYEGHPSFDKSQWKYYLEEASQKPEVEAQLKKIRAEYANIKPEEIKVIDPCMGSGHILVCAFDVLLQIYTSCGWSERDAAKSIIENNLYGLDIDDRAGQLAYFAVMMKARKYNRRILNGAVKPNVLAIQDSGFMNDDFIAYVAEKDTRMKADLTLLRSSLKDAKEYGSILNVPKLNFAALYERIDIISRSFAEDMFQISYQSIAVDQLLPLVKQAEVMAQKYDVVVTNPPYMGNGSMSATLSDFVKQNYPDSKSDLFACCIECGFSMLKPWGYNAMVTMHSWMFLSSLERLRDKILRGKSICSLLQMDNMVMGIAFGTAATVIRNTHICNYKASFTKVTMSDILDAAPKTFPVENVGVFVRNNEHFFELPGHTIAYWVSRTAINSFLFSALEKYATTRLGMSTANNDLFMRNWFEVSAERIGFGIPNPQDAIKSRKKWFPYNKGGSFRKWYGNNDYVVNWENDGAEIRNFKDEKTGRIRSHNYNGEYGFRESLTWSDISSSHNFGIRYSPAGKLFDGRGSSLFSSPGKIRTILAFLCSKLAGYYLSIINQTMVFNVGDVAMLPINEIIFENNEIETLANKSIAISKEDWDSFETSWDFKKHPLV